MRALLIVDIQNDFLPGGRLAVPDGDSIIPLVNAMQHKFDLVVATQDWHPPNHLSFASNHSNKKPFESIDLFGLPQVLWPDHCVQGSEGAMLATELGTSAVAAIFRKGMNPEIDSYSGFFDNGRRQHTGLEAYLRSFDVKEVYVCGLAADYCVFYTARDAHSLGFKTCFITDATRYIAKETYDIAIAELSSVGVHLVSSSQIS